MNTLRSVLALVVVLPLLLLAPSPPAAAGPSADASTALVVIDQPRGGTSGPTLYVSGWAADPASPSGTGIERVDVYLDGERDAGGTYLGRAAYGLQRPDVAAHLGSPRFTLTGFALQATVAPGPHTVYVYAQTPDGGIAGGGPRTAAVLVSATAAGGPPGEIPIWMQAPTSVTWRIPGVSGSYTFDVVTASAAYPPGPADTGGPIYGPVSYGLGVYGPPWLVPSASGWPTPDYPGYTNAYWSYYATTFALPSFWERAYLYGVAPYGLYVPVSGLYGSGYGLDALYYPNYYRRSYLGYLGVVGVPSIIYCPVYTYLFC
jgi:hypothetical protein